MVGADRCGSWAAQAQLFDLGLDQRYRRRRRQGGRRYRRDHQPRINATLPVPARTPGCQSDSGRETAVNPGIANQPGAIILCHRRKRAFFPLEAISAPANP